MGKIPVLFIGHGSPMNAIEENEFTRGWKRIADGIPRPKAILSISAHWYTEGTSILDETNPIPVYQLSIDRTLNADAHFDIGKEIKSLRENGVLILGRQENPLSWRSGLQSIFIH